MWVPSIYIWKLFFFLVFIFFYLNLVRYMPYIFRPSISFTLCRHVLAKHSTATLNNLYSYILSVSLSPPWLHVI